MSQSVIQVDNLSKRYRLGQTKTLRQRLAGMIVPGRGNGRADSGAEREFWALKDVSFQVQPGRVLGVIGHNGAGKSTLLKLLSRITDPTSGHASIRGRVASLLEVGTGFHPELTGRENIFLNGAILGLKRAEIKNHFDHIVDFAEIGRFLDTPVKRYSSGMYVRLAFAIAAHLEPEVLIVDEVLAVGDAAFQRKCLGKMGDVAQSGRTVIFVSHNMAAVRNLCHEAILLNVGQVQHRGDTSGVIDAYLNQLFASTADDGQVLWRDDLNAPGGEEVRLLSVRTLDPQGMCRGVFDLADPVRVELTYRVLKPIDDMRWVLKVACDDGSIAMASTDHTQRDLHTPPGIYRSLCTIPEHLLNVGCYTLQINAGSPGLKVFVPSKPYIKFQTTRTTDHGSFYAERWPGAVSPHLDWELKQIGLGQSATGQGAAA
jgi:homopolymeric O-antigen transport system ATP-binding protein